MKEKQKKTLKITLGHLRYFSIINFHSYISTQRHYIIFSRTDRKYHLEYDNRSTNIFISRKISAGTPQFVDKVMFISVKGNV